MANESFRIPRGIFQLFRSVSAALEKQSCRACRIYKSSRSSRRIIEDDEFREYHTA